MDEAAMRYSLDILKKYSNPFGDILRKQKLMFHKTEIRKDLALIKLQPLQKDFDIVRKHLDFLLWLIVERM